MMVEVTPSRSRYALGLGLICLSLVTNPGCGSDTTPTDPASGEPQAVVEGEHKMAEYMKSEAAKKDLNPR